MELDFEIRIWRFNTRLRAEYLKPDKEPREVHSVGFHVPTYDDDLLDVEVKTRR